MKILIVEDHLPSAEALKKLLEVRMEAVEIEIATTLKEGLSKAVSFHADVTLLDLQLPDASIQEVIHSIVKFPPPVIVITDHDEDDIVLECFRYRAQNVLTKAALRERLDSLESTFQANALIRAITNTYLRSVAPQTICDGGRS